MTCWEILCNVSNKYPLPKLSVGPRDITHFSRFLLNYHLTINFFWPFALGHPGFNQLVEFDNLRPNEGAENGRQKYTKNTTVNTSHKSYCWWFKKSGDHHLGCQKHCKFIMGQTTVPSTGEFTGFLNHQQYVCRQSYTSGGLIHYYSGWSTSPTNVQATTIKRSNSPPALFRANQCFKRF